MPPEDRNADPDPAGNEAPPLLTFLFSDIEGSTKLVLDLRESYPALLARHHEVLRDAWRRHGGREISTEGDSFVVVFGDPTAAVTAAADAQRALDAEPWIDGRDVRVRMGIHTGTAVAVADTFVGIEIHRAARIAAAAHGAQTLVSDVTQAAVVGGLPAGLTLRHLGRHRLKDVGVQKLYQLDVDGLQREFPALRALEAHPTNLPTATSALVDRRAEADALASLVREHSLVTVTGTGGIGKSRLVLAVARDLIPEFPDGLFYLDVDAFDSAAAVAVELAGMLGVRPSPNRSTVEGVAESLRDRQVLIVLDTIDRTDGLAELVWRLIRDCRSVRVLATGRTSLHLAAEHAFPLAPLTVPDRGAALADLEASPSVRLFVERSRAARNDFVLTSANASTVAEICARLDGLPLAIELAAARIRVLSPDALLARLARRLPLLTGGPRDVPDRQRTLRDTIAWSVDQLEPRERAVLATLGVFAGSFDLAAAEAVVGLDQIEVLDAIDVLVDESLVISLQVPSARFRLLGTIREFVVEPLERSDELVRNRDRHAGWYSDLAEARQSELQGERDLETARAIEEDIDEFRAALQWTLGTDHESASAGTPGSDDGRPATGLRLAAALGRFWWLHGRIAEGVEWLERALDRGPAGDTVARATALLWSGVCHDSLGRFDVARARLEAALSAARAIRDPRLEAHALNSLGVALRSLGDLVRARELVAESLARKRDLGDDRGVAVGLNNLGIFDIDEERFEDARRLLEEAVALDRAAGAEVGAAYSLMPLGAALIGLGRLEEGEAALLESLATFCELDDAEGVADGLTWLARSAVERGDDRRAARLFLAGQAIRAREGLPERPSGGLVPIIEAAIARLDPQTVAGLRAEATAVDVPAALTLAGLPA